MQNQDNIIEINKEVSIVAYYFKPGVRKLRCYPKKMEYDGRTIVFTEQGLRHPTKKGQRMIHIFDMTDDQADYRLEFDAEQLSWNLVYVADKAYGPMDEKFSAANLMSAAA